MGEQILSYKKVTKKITVTSKPLLKKKCIVKVKKRKICGTSESELKLRNSNTGRRKDCKKKTNIVCPQRRKKERKKVILIRKIIKREACPQPEIYVTAPQGTQGPPGPQGIQGPPGPTGPIIIPLVSTMLTAKRYFYITNSDIELPSERPANLFTNDDGESITEFTDFDQNSYANLYINGIMQVGGSYSVSPSALTIKHDHDTIFAGTPLILETVRLSVQIIP